MNPKDQSSDYSLRYYKHVTYNRKRQIIDKMIDDLYQAQLDMIDQAVAYSDMQAAKDVIMHIKAL